MDVQLIRDLVIIISGIVVAVAAIFVAVTMASVSRKVNDFLKSAKTATMKLEALATIADDELRTPILQAARFIQGIALGISEISKIFKKGGC
ncbi:MAG: hypothetical protein R6V59_03205 [Dehalococcoidia bacterium]